MTPLIEKLTSKRRTNWSFKRLCRGRYAATVAASVIREVTDVRFWGRILALADEASP